MFILYGVDHYGYEKRKLRDKLELQATPVANFKRPRYPKSAEEAQELKEQIAKNEKLQVLFGHLNEEATNHVIEAMYK